MKVLFAMALALAFLSAACAADQLPIPPAVISDPAPDAAHPPYSSQVLIPSHGKDMNALLYLAGGAGVHPTMVLLHGLPGNEQNLDLAQAVRRAGWNVLTLHYRGSWGSPGVFSIEHVLEDADAAVAFVRRPDIAAKFAIDTQRVVMAGHSMGGFATAAHARIDATLLGVILIDAWNVGASGEVLSKLSAAARAAEAAKEFNDFGNSLHGATPASIADEIVARRADWNFQLWASALNKRPLLVIDASGANGVGGSGGRLAEAVRGAGGKVTSVTMPTDHSFQDHRLALEAEIVTWLQGLPAR